MDTRFLFVLVWLLPACFGPANVDPDSPLASGAAPPLPLERTAGAGGMSPSTETNALPCPCTRRLEGELIWSCPRGSGAAALQPIGPSGGSIYLSETAQSRISAAMTWLDVGFDALESTVGITLAELEDPPPSDLVDYSPVIYVGPELPALAQPARLSIPVSNAYDAAVLGGTLSVFWSRQLEGPYQPLEPSSVFNNYVEVTITETGYYVAGFEMTDAIRECVPESPPIDPGFTGLARCPCSRRVPGSGCGALEESLSTTQVGLEGADLTLPGAYGLAFEIYFGALEAPADVTLTQLTTAPPWDYIDFSQIYRVEPVELELQIAGRIEIPVSNSIARTLQVSASMTRPDAIGIYRSASPEGPYERVSGSYLEGNYAVGSFLGGGYYFAGYPRPPEFAPCY